MAGSRWTPEEEAALAAMYAERSNAEIGAALGRTEDAVRSRAIKLGLAKPEGYRKPQPRRLWTDEKREWFRSFVPGHTESEISAEHERLYGFPLSEGQIGNAKTRLGVKSGTVGGRFGPGREPFNKGKTWDEFMPPESQERSRATCFKAGEVNDRRDGWIKPVGHERTDVDGYIWVKVREGLQRNEPGHYNENYRLKHHLVWEQAHGEPVPPSTMIVFADRDKRNFDPCNLVAVPRSLWATISHNRMAYWDAESLGVCVAAARLKAAAHARAMSPRKCRRCGSTFDPRYEKQRTCDACLGRKGRR